MKTVSAAAVSCFRLGLPLLFVLKATMAFAAIPVGNVGNVLTFDTRPLAADGWTTLSLGGANTDITNAAALDEFVQRTEARSITNDLDVNAIVFPAPASAFLARWNSAGHYLQTKPTANAATLLVATLQNVTGSDWSSLILSYDFGALVADGSSIDEAVPGQRIYYNLTGLSNSWVNIGQLSSSTQALFCVELSSAWEPGALLYLLWADDNGLYGESGSLREGAYTIDNFSISRQTVIPAPIAITQQPHRAVVEEGRSTNFIVVCSGSNLRYQWFKNRAAVPFATNNLLFFPGARASDAGSYFVRITGSGSSLSPLPCSGPTPTQIDSATVTLTVVADTENPVPISAVRLADGTNIIVSFDEPMDSSSINKYAFTVDFTSGGAPLEVLDAVLLNRTNVILTTATSPSLANYTLSIDPSVSDTQGNGVGVTNLPLATEVRLLSIHNTFWKYNHDGVDLGVAWRANLCYDDSAWSNGISLFDGKAPTNRVDVNGEPVMTILPLHFGSGAYSTDDLPVYYFRAHFHLPTDPSEVVDLRLRTLVDDYDAAWLNGYETPVYTNARLAQTNLDAYDYSGGTALGVADFLPPSGYFHLDPTNLLFADNLLAVKLFQVTPSSSDITFAYELTAIISQFAVPGPPALRITADASAPGQWIIRWDPAGQLYESTRIDAPAESWTPVSDTCGGRYVVAATDAAKFYTLRQ